MKLKDLLEVLGDCEYINIVELFDDRENPYYREVYNGCKNNYISSDYLNKQVINIGAIYGEVQLTLRIDVLR